MLNFASKIPIPCFLFILSRHMPTEFDFDDFSDAPPTTLTPRRTPGLEFFNRIDLARRLAVNKYHYTSPHYVVFY